MLVEQGITATLVDERMTRSVLVTATDAQTAYLAALEVDARFDELRAVVRTCGRFVELIGFRHEIAANLLFLRFEFSTGEASGHNMATLAADALLTHILGAIPGISGLRGARGPAREPWQGDRRGRGQPRHRADDDLQRGHRQQLHRIGVPRAGRVARPGR